MLHAHFTFVQLQLSLIKQSTRCLTHLPVLCQLIRSQICAVLCVERPPAGGAINGNEVEPRRTSRRALESKNQSNQGAINCSSPLKIKVVAECTLRPHPAREHINLFGADKSCSNHPPT